MTEPRIIQRDGNEQTTMDLQIPAYGTTWRQKRGGPVAVILDVEAARLTWVNFRHRGRVHTLRLDQFLQHYQQLDD